MLHKGGTTLLASWFATCRYPLSQYVSLSCGNYYLDWLYIQIAQKEEENKQKFYTILNGVIKKSVFKEFVISVVQQICTLNLKVHQPQYTNVKAILKLFKMSKNSAMSSDPLFIGVGVLSFLSLFLCLWFVFICSLLKRNQLSRKPLNWKGGDVRDVLSLHVLSYSTAGQNIATTGNLSIPNNFSYLWFYYFLDYWLVIVFFVSEPVGSTSGKIFAPYTIFKGKAALSVTPLLPTFTKLGVLSLHVSLFYQVLFFPPSCFRWCFPLFIYPILHSLVISWLIVVAPCCWSSFLPLVSASMTMRGDR